MQPRYGLVAGEPYQDIASAEDADAWFVDVRADSSELGWRMEVEADGDWRFYDDTEGDRS